MPTDSESLNPYHRLRLRITFQHIDGLLSNIEHILRASVSKSPFPRYVDDMDEGRRKAIERGIAQIRTRLVAILHNLGIEAERATIPATRAMHGAVVFAQIAVEELMPKRMRGYGEVTPKAATELNAIVNDLLTEVSKLNECVGGDEAGAEREDFDEG